MLAIVVDTNTVLSAFLWGGLPYKVIALIQTRTVVLLTTDPLIHELQDVLSRDKFAKRFAEVGLTPVEVVKAYMAAAKLVTEVPVPEGVVRDKADMKVLACAVGGKADRIVSGDNDLLDLKRYEGIRIVTARELLDELSDESNAE